MSHLNETGYVKLWMLECLMDEINDGPWMRVAEAAAYTRVSESTLNKLRVYGGGPKFTKRGRTVFYRRSWCDEWFTSGLATSTSAYQPAPDVSSNDKPRADMKKVR